MSYVLVFEDDKSILFTLKTCIEAMEEKVELCYNHYHVLFTLNYIGPPKVVLLDYVVHGEDIQEVIATLRTISSKIILMTAFPNPESIVNEYKLDGLLKKPFTLEDLSAFIK